MPKGKHENHRRGPEHYAWTQERIVSSHGYVRLRVGKEHPLADPNGYAYEHLVVWVSAGNPRPNVSEVLHHRNECKGDNRLDNLELLTRQEHSKSHHPPKWPREELTCKRHGLTTFVVRQTKEGWRNATCLECKRDRKRKKAAGRELDGRTWNQVPS